MKDEYEELRKNSEMGNINTLKTILINHKFNKKDIDVPIRHCIYKYDSLKRHYSECVRELLKHADLNYANSKYENSTLMMITCAKGNIVLIKELLRAANCASPQVLIDLSLHDSNKLNFMHYILYKNTNETDALEILNLLLSTNERYKPMVQKALLDEDIKGNTALTLILLKGWHQMLLKYLELNEFKQYLIKGSNLLHCAITGKNLKCLKLMLFHSSIEDFKAKNSEGDTPADLAKKKKYLSFVKRIENYEEMLASGTAKADKSILLKHSINANEIMTMYQEGKFNEALMLLNEYKLNKSIVGDIENLSIEWNMRLTRYQISSKGGSSCSLLNNGPSKGKEITKEKILSKFVDNSATSNASSNQSKLTTIMDLIKFLSDNASPMNIMDHINEESYPIDLLIYNKGIVSLSLGDIFSALKTFSLYLTHILPQSKDDYYKWITYVNSTFIIIEHLIKLNQIPIASVVISAFEEYLFTTFKQTKKNSYPTDVEAIFELLSNNEVINQSSPTWDEAFCYVNLLKSLCDLANGKKYIIEYKKLINNCNYSNELRVFSRLDALYMCIKIKMNYLKSHTSKCFKKISLMRELYFNESQEHKLFYFNSIGIVNLKLKNYLNAEYYFKNGIITYKDLVTLGKSKRFLDLNLKGSYLSYMKFNLALSLFYQRKFKQAQALLKEMTKINIMNKNVYVWYRLGLSTLEIYLSEKKREMASRDKWLNEIVKKSFGYGPSKRKDLMNEPEKDNEETANKKQASKGKKTSQHLISEDEDSMDELYAQFEREYGNLSIDKGYTDKAPMEKRRIILSSQRVLKQDPANSQNKKELIDAINVFKHTLLLLKEGEQNSQLFKDIYFIYAKKREDCKISKAFNQNVFINTYLNLLFCWSLNENWLEVLHTVRSLLSKQKALTNDIKIKLANYQVEALIALNRHKEARESLLESLQAFQQDNFHFDYINKPTGSVVNDFLFKVTLNFNLARVHILNQNIPEAKKVIKSTIDVFNKGKTEDLPGSAINLILYLFLSEGKGSWQKALSLIKSRRIDLSKWD